MSQAATEQPQSQGEPVATEPVSTGTEVTQQQTQAPDVPYREQLEAFPESLRPIAERQFQEWDANVNKRFEALHSQYEPWKEIIEGADPSTVTQALQLAQVLETEPQQLYDALVKAYGFGGQGPATATEPVTSGVPAEELDPENPLTKELKELREQLQVVAGAVVTRQQNDEMTIAHEKLDNILLGLKDRHGEFNQTYVLTLIANGVDPDKAVEQYKADLQGALTQQQTPAAPTVVGDGGGQPAESIDVTKMTPTQTKAHVAKLLEQAQAQGG